MLPDSAAEPIALPLLRLVNNSGPDNGPRNSCCIKQINANGRANSTISGSNEPGKYMFTT